MASVNRIYELADILQVPLDKQDGAVSGQLARDLYLGPLRFGLQNKVVSSFLSQDEAGALLRVGGNMYLLATTSLQGATLVVVDVSKVKGGIGPDKLSSCKTIREANELMEGAIAAAFVFEGGSQVWDRVGSATSS